MDENIFVSFGLHFHQPWWQSKETLLRIHRDCYLPLARWISSSNIPVFAHLSGSFLKLCQAHGLDEFIDGLRPSAQKGQLLLTGGAQHHPILPKIPPEEAFRQINLHRQLHRDIFDMEVRGLFPPEMAYSPQVGDLAFVLGLEWVLANDLQYGGRYQEAPRNYLAMDRGVPFLLRSHLWSTRIAFPSRGPTELAHGMVNDLQFSLTGRQYIVLMMDAETFGGHLEAGGQPAVNFFQMMGILNQRARVVLPTQILAEFPRARKTIPSGSWSTLPQDVAEGIPYPLWDHPHNRAHRALWELVDLTYLAFLKAGSPDAVRSRMDRAWNSCKWWWVSRGNFSPGLLKSEVANLESIIFECVGQDDKVFIHAQDLIGYLWKILGIA